MIDELRRLHEQATQPPWAVDGIGDVHGNHRRYDWATLIAETHHNGDGALIAAARNALPALLALADAARAWRDAKTGREAREAGERILAALEALDI